LVLLGGRQFKTPLGYLNVRYFDDAGREVRTVQVDEERAPYLLRAFRQFSTGEYSLKRLHDLLTAEGMTVRPSSTGRRDHSLGMRIDRHTGEL
jgi:hypothetical protein